MSAQPALKLVNPETGELHDSCPECTENKRTLKELTRKYHGVLSELGKLREDREAKARTHEKWPIAIGVFRFWQTKTGHERAEFTPDRFWLLEPFLRRAEERGDNPGEVCREAIRGLLASEYHMKLGRHAKREGRIYDEFARPFESQDKFEMFRSQALEPDQPIRRMSLIEHATDVAGRVLERAQLIEKATDPEAVALLLVEIDRLNRRWLDGAA